MAGFSVDSRGFPSKVTLSPTILPAGGLKSSTLDLSYELVHNTIPLDSNPANFIGFKLVTTKHNPVIFSIGINC